MIRPGLCSITFHALPTEDALALAATAGLEGIEWASKSHVPLGDLQAAERVKTQTADAGLVVTSYGTYYRMGSGEEFSPVLETALALGAPIIRVWAGQKDYAKSSPEEIGRVVDETLRVADLCHTAGLKIGFEHHDGTLTSRNAGAAVLLSSADLSELLALSDRLMVFYRGRIVAAFRNSDELTTEMLGACMLGLSKQSPEEMRAALA